MKKMIIALIVVLALIAGVVTYFDIQKKNDEKEQKQEISAALSGIMDSTAEEAEEEEEPAKLQSLDYEAIYASHDPDEVVMKVEGKDITWGEYYYWLEQAGQTAEYYMGMYNAYGYPVSWEDFAPQITEYTEEQIRVFAAIEKFAEEYDLKLSDDEKAEIEDEINKQVETKYGEVSEANRAAFFEEMGVSEEMFNRLAGLNYLYQNGYVEVYGEKGEKVTDEEAVNWLEENKYMYASHILLATMDFGTMEELGENEKAEKKELADSIAKELQAITDNGKLVERFKELKKEYCEDTGKETYPDGYVFTDGKMVEEFENGCKELDEYQVSDPILSTYGYHVILRLPLNADAVMEYSEAGEPLSVRQKYANTAYGKLMDEYNENLEIEKTDAIKNLNLLDYLKG